MTATPKTIEAICRAWLASHARLELECIEHGDDEKLTSAACERDDARTDKLFERLQKMKPVSDDDIKELLWLAEELMKFSLDNSERIKTLLQMAIDALIDRKVKRAA